MLGYGGINDDGRKGDHDAILTRPFGLITTEENDGSIGRLEVSEVGIYLDPIAVLFDQQVLL